MSGIQPYNVLSQRVCDLCELFRKNLPKFRSTILNDGFTGLPQVEIEYLFAYILCLKFNLYRNENLEDIIDMFISRKTKLTSFNNPYTMTMKDLEYLEKKVLQLDELFGHCLIVGVVYVVQHMIQN